VLPVPLILRAQFLSLCNRCATVVQPLCLVAREIGWKVRAELRGCGPSDSTEIFASRQTTRAQRARDHPQSVAQNVPITR
jgi:hypothetical protein